MTLYRKLSRNPKQFLTVTGMNLHQFQELSPHFTQAFERQEQKRKAVVVKTKVARRRSAGGGSQFAHELVDQMLMLLIYYRLYLTQEYLTLLFKHQNRRGLTDLCSGQSQSPFPRQQRAGAARQAHWLSRRVQRSLSRTDFHH